MIYPSQFKYFPVLSQVLGRVYWYIPGMFVNHSGPVVIGDGVSKLGNLQ